MLLRHLGAEVAGYSLDIPSEPAMYRLLKLEEAVASRRGDIRDGESFKAFLDERNPEILIHLAAQPLVRKSYREPVDTFSTNLMGTLQVLQATLQAESLRSIVVITTDKCYRNEEWVWGYRENDVLGGHDPYSASKACVELVVESWRSSFRPLSRYPEHKTAIATARAGNVIGGGDWGEDRLIPDCVRAVSAGQPVGLRSPASIRPWQHVLEPLVGYLKLAEELWNRPESFSGAWNFGPGNAEEWSVRDVVARFLRTMGDGSIQESPEKAEPVETQALRLDSSKALRHLKWKPCLPVAEAVDWTAEWYKRWRTGGDLMKTTCDQICAYLRKVSGESLE